MSLESRLIAWLRENLPSDSRLEVGLGDDAAVLASDGESIVVTTDMLTDKVDFLLEEIDPGLIGHKALGVNLSDLAAMAAIPISVFVSLVLPKDGTKKLTALELAIKLYEGMIPLAEKFNVVIAGGDTNTWSGPLAISITAIGKPSSDGPLLRSGAQLGDQLLVTGQLGGSILGKHLKVEPRIEEALLLHERYGIHAAMDISDGLAIDASRLAKASGLGACIALSSLPLSAASQDFSEKSGRPAIEHALSDGEDFELLLAVSAKVAEQILADQPLDIPLTSIGEFIAKKGLWQRISSNEIIPLEIQGFEHEGTI